MSWLRTDDGFPQHPKFEGWTPLQKWSFLELMHYCAKYRTKGRIPTDLTLLPRTVTPSLITLAHQAKWLDQDESGVYWIHDWNFYNPEDTTNADRQKRYRDRNKTVTNAVTSAVTNAVTKPLPRARAGAAVPVPSFKEALEAQALLDPTATEHPNESVRAGASEHEAINREALDPTDPIHRLLNILPDAHTGTEAILRSITTDPYAYDQARDEVQRVNGKTGLAVTILRRIAAGGPAFDLQPPDSNGTTTETTTKPARPLYDQLANWIRNVGHVETSAGLDREIDDQERRTGQTLTTSERADLLNLHATITDPEPTPPPQRTPPPALRSAVTQP